MKLGEIISQSELDYLRIISELKRYDKKIREQIHRGKSQRKEIIKANEQGWSEKKIKAN